MGGKVVKKGVKVAKKLVGKVTKKDGEEEDVTEKGLSFAYPESTSMTSMALGLAKAELTQGRAEASSVVVVITDGKPLSAMNTGKAAGDLKKSARLIWVVVGGDAG